MIIYFPYSWRIASIKFWLLERGYVQGDMCLDTDGLARKGLFACKHDDYLIWAFNPDGKYRN